MQATNSGQCLSRRSGAGDSGLAFQPSRSPQLSALPNRSLKRDCQRRATRPAEPLVQSSASRAWCHTVGSRLAPTLGLHEQHFLWAHHGSPQAARPGNLSPRSRDASAGVNLVSFRLQLASALSDLCLQEQHRLQAHQAASAHHVCALRELRSQLREHALPASARRAPVSAVLAHLALGRPARYTSRAGLTRRLSGTANGAPPGPRSRLCNHRLRGPGGTPSAAA